MELFAVAHVSWSKNIYIKYIFGLGAKYENLSTWKRVWAEIERKQAKHIIPPIILDYFEWGCLSVNAMHYA